MNCVNSAARLCCCYLSLIFFKLILLFPYIRRWKELAQMQFRSANSIHINVYSQIADVPRHKYKNHNLSLKKKTLTRRAALDNLKEQRITAVSQDSQVEGRGHCICIYFFAKMLLLFEKPVEGTATRRSSKQRGRRAGEHIFLLPCRPQKSKNWENGFQCLFCAD